jgi:hypothetical protein
MPQLPISKGLPDWLKDLTMEVQRFRRSMLAICWVRFEVVEGDNACNCGRECGRNLWIVHIGDMPDASDIEVMNLGLVGTEGAAHIAPK